MTTSELKAEKKVNIIGDKGKSYTITRASVQNYNEEPEGETDEFQKLLAATAANPVNATELLFEQGYRAEDVQP